MLENCIERKKGVHVIQNVKAVSHPHPAHHVAAIFCPGCYLCSGCSCTFSLQMPDSSMENKANVSTLLFSFYVLKTSIMGNYLKQTDAKIAYVIIKRKPPPAKLRVQCTPYHNRLTADCAPQPPLQSPPHLRHSEMDFCLSLPSKT